MQLPGLLRSSAATGRAAGLALLCVGLALPAVGQADVERRIYDDELVETPGDGPDLERPGEYAMDRDAGNTSEPATFEQDGEDIAEELYGPFDRDLNRTTREDDRPGRSESH